MNIDYEIGQKIKVPVMGGFEESEITGITISVKAEDGKIVKNSYDSTISYKNVWGGREDVTEIYANFEKEEYANKIEKEIIIDIKALYLEQYITLHRYMGGSKLKVDRVQRYKLIIDKNGIKTGYIDNDVEFEIFTSIDDFKEKISSNDLIPEGEKFVAKKTYANGGWVLVDADTERKLGEYETESEARKMMYEYEGNSEIVEKSEWDKLPPNPNRHSPAYNFADGGDTEEVYIEFLNKEKGFKKDTKYFNSYEEAVEWAKENFDKFNPDMIKYKYADGGAIYPDLSLQKPDVVNDSIKVPEFEIKSTIKQDLYLSKNKVVSSKDAVDILKEIWKSDTINAYEQAYILYLNKQNKVIGYYHHSMGGIDGTVMDIQMISGMAIKSLAKGVIISHNHPSGITRPSDADSKVTKQLKDALSVFNILLVDSIILTDKDYFSFADEGLL